MSSIYHYSHATKGQFQCYLIDTWCFVQKDDGRTEIFKAKIPSYDVATVYKNIDNFDTSIYYNRYDSWYDNTKIIIGGVKMKLDISSQNEMLLTIIKSFEYLDDKLLAEIQHQDYAYCDRSSPTDLVDIMSRYKPDVVENGNLFKAAQNNAKIIAEIDAGGSSITTLAATITTLRRVNAQHLEEIMALKITIASQVDLISNMRKDRDTWKTNYEKLESDKSTYKQNMKAELQKVIDGI